MFHALILPEFPFGVPEGTSFSGRGPSGYWAMGYFCIGPGTGSPVNPYFEIRCEV